jgi:hypothetical protein
VTEERPTSEFSAYMARVLKVYENMDEKEREELHRWERKHLDGHSLATSDWPGWEKYVGKAPWKLESTIASRSQGISVEVQRYPDEVVLVPCATCRTTTNHTLVLSVDIRQEFDRGDIVGWTSFQTVRCLGCESFSFRRTHQNSEDFYLDEGDLILIEASEVYPPRAVGRQKLDGSGLLPTRIRRIYDESYRALCSELPVLTAVGIRALVEAVCQEENTQGRTLENQIDDLVNKQVLGRAGADVLHKLRIMGNKSVHEMKRHDTRTLGTAFDVVENLLREVYIFPTEFD